MCDDSDKDVENVIYPPPGFNFSFDEWHRIIKNGGILPADLYEKLKLAIANSASRAK